MKSPAVIALEGADWPSLTPILLSQTVAKIAQFSWRSVYVKNRDPKSLVVECMGAEDFINGAIEKLFSGQRNYNETLSLEKNIMRTVESDIWSHLDAKKRIKIRDTPKQAGEQCIELLLELSPDQVRNNEPQAARDEELAYQNEMLTAFSDSIKDDEELSYLLMAYEEGKVKPAEIHEATGISPDRIYELRRKLRDRADKFISSYNEHKGAKLLKELSI